jgi:metal-responsive CopG/Arc/MetJ family transcriptional regulator
MRERVTVSLPGDLLRRAERVARSRGATTRSAVVARALELFVHRARQREIEASLEAYYGKQPAAEQQEERAMVRAFNRSQRRHDLDDEGR